MQYEIMGGRFNEEENQKRIQFILNNKKSTREIEKKFKEIALTILPSEGFFDIYNPDVSQSVPFDFIAKRDDKLALIELKGRDDGFNYSSEVQYSRLKQVVHALLGVGVNHSPFLIQINLKYSMYQILTEKFYNLIFEYDFQCGTEQSIESSIAAIKKYCQDFNLANELKKINHIQI